LPKSIFLLPGYGAQGATADMTRAAFIDGRGAIVSASRSILYAHRDQHHAGKGWRRAIESAVNEMSQELQRVISAGASG
jgi:orotidine-5'-phosphate decarboxylase